MREIKFRGVTPKGETVYGDLSNFDTDIYINDRRVLSESVEQFAGYDENDDEIYEGDIVVAHGKEYKVKIDFCYGAFHDLKRCHKK